MKHDSIMRDWTFLFELQYWRGKRFTQRFHAWATPEKVIWDQAVPLFEIQQAYKRLRKAERARAGR